eukprot:gene27892-biopygen16590
MHGHSAMLREFDAIVEGYDAGLRAVVDLMICPPATLLHRMAVRSEGHGVTIGGQDCHPKGSGAHTGDLSAHMLADAGAVAVIVGHSERRADHREADEVIAAKARAAAGEALTAIVCVGETAEERRAGETLRIVSSQVAGSIPDEINPEKLVVAYEPVWAIGSGLTPTVADVAEVHALISAALVDRFGEAGQAIRILYGGSVKPSNARELLSVANVNGALVGGASLKAHDFLAIAETYR